MPRYWMPGFAPYYYCWADNAEQAKESMKARFQLLGLEWAHTHSVVLAIDQSENSPAVAVWVSHEPDFRVKSDA